MPISIVRTRVKARAIWQNIADGVLFGSEQLHSESAKPPIESEVPPSVEYAEALNFIQDVAKSVLLADKATDNKRAGLFVQAVQLSGKTTKYESELIAAITLVDDFFPVDFEPKVGEKKMNKNSKIVKAFRAIGQLNGDVDFDLYLSDRTDHEIIKDIERLRMKG